MRFAAILSGVALALLLAMPEGQESPTIRADVNLVQLNVRMTDSAGRTVSGLPKEAFELLVDGTPHPITVLLCAWWEVPENRRGGRWRMMTEHAAWQLRE